MLIARSCTSPRTARYPGAVALKERPELGPWLADGKRDRWDAVWVSTQDRLGRDDLHFMAFVKDLLDWRKTILVHDDPSFDVTTETGRLIAYAKATQAAAELTRIRKRAVDSRDYLRRNGYLRTLPGPEGREPKGAKGVAWHPSVIGRQFRKLSCIGQVQYQDKEFGKLRTAEQDNGDPVMFTEEPILTREEREAVLVRIGERAGKPQRARRSVARLSGVARCGTCRQRMTMNRVTHQLKNGPVTYERYRCASTTTAKQCDEPAYIEKETLDALLDTFLSRELGSREEIRIVKHAGEDHTAELERYRARLDRLEKEDEQGWYDDHRDSYLKKRRNILEHIKDLQAKPVIAATVTREPTGRTLKQKWEGMTSEEQREHLIAHNVIIGAWRSGQVPKQRAAFIWWGDLSGAPGAMAVEPGPDVLGGLQRLNLTQEQDAKVQRWIKEAVPEGADRPWTASRWARSDRQL
ncbi:recombinase family protein [Streptomyces sp. Pv4-95]|uniref:recombinase family protein n=1 Tax=Streptomyces sp. Pv4-95 TaxID=3049543 RepID=UPI003892BF66